MTKARYRWLTPENGIFFVAFLLRVVLAFYNRGFNDDHVEVISLIADKGLFPPKDACYECYHPQLYHMFCAFWIKLFKIADPNGRRVFAQYVNVVSGMFTLALLKRFLRKIEVPRRIAFWAFALIALNPDFLGINCQASNDSFAIFFGTLSFYCGWMAFRSFELSWVLATSFAVICASLSKASGLAIFTAIFAAWTIAWATGYSERKKILRALVVLAVLFFAIVPLLGGYYSHYVQYGNPLVMNDSKDPSPYWFKETYVNRPGITSIVSGFGTFRILSLIETPYVTPGFTGYPIHRTSLWSQLYGRLNFVHFQEFPKSWESMQPWLLDVGRIIFVCALVPFFIGFKGLVFHFRRFITLSFRKEIAGWDFLESSYLLLGIGGLTAVVAKVSYDIRCFCSMKSIYILPALLCAAKCFVDGYVRVTQALVSSPFARKADFALNCILGLLCLLYCVDIGALIYDLSG